MVIFYDDNNQLIASLSESLDENVDMMTEIFSDCGDVVKKEFYVGESNRIYLIYIDGLCDSEVVMEGIIKPITFEWGSKTCEEAGDTDWVGLATKIYSYQAQTVDIAVKKNINEVLLAVLKGDSALLVDGFDGAFVVSTKNYPTRGISENDTEPGLRGPRDQFIESFRKNTALIRRRIRDPKLKLKQGVIGQRSRTDYGVMYLEDIADEKIVNEIIESIHEYDIDAIFDSGMAEQLMEGNWHSPFPKFQSTTRPDKVASAISEGRVAVVFDNSPEVIIAPVNFNILLQAADDYYNRWTVGSFSRLIRYIATFIAIVMPGMYISATVFNSEILPEKLLFAIVNARYSVTFSVVTEVILMEFFFELLREAGIRLPGPLGNTIGVVGGLIVGQAAVDAGIVSTIVVIVVALTAIASFAIPNEVFASVFRLFKFYVIIAASLFGIYGVVVALISIAIHMSGLESFGVPFLRNGIREDDEKSSMDYVIKGPIDTMVNRPVWVKNESRIRLRNERKN